MKKKLLYSILGIFIILGIHLILGIIKYDKIEQNFIRFKYGDYWCT